MKFIFHISFLVIQLITSQLYAQTVPFGVNYQSASSELSSKDPVTQNRFYKSTSIPLKKGWGVQFFMRSKDFTPMISVQNPKGAEIGNRNLFTYSGNEATSSFIVSSDDDTVVYLYLTSQFEKDTGKFTYGYRILQASQMTYSNEVSTCDRFRYIANQWFLNWEFVPRVTHKEIDKDYPQFGYYDVIKTGQTIGNADSAKFYKMGGHEEKLEEKLMTSLDNAQPLRDYYIKIAKEIEACLDMKSWTKKEEKGSVGNTTGIFEHTWFILNGGGMHQHNVSFKIGIYLPEKPTDKDKMSVYIEFD